MSVLRTTELHSDWQLAAQRWLEPPGKLAFSTLDWLPASVPGHVHADLVAQGVILDPFVALGELGCQWIDEEDWSYRTGFEFEADPALPRRVLRFEGLDTLASVHLNGELLAQHDNMFVPLELDVSDRLKRGRNELRVDFRSAARVGRERRARYLASENLPDDTLRFDERAFVRKAQYMYGWDWGPRLVSAGIWGRVTLLEHAGRLLDVHVTQQHLPDGAVELEFRSQADGAGEVVHFLEGRPEPIRDGTRLRLEQPELWWPAGLGAQKLHRLLSLLVPSLGASLAENQAAALDSRTTRLGLRSLRLVREHDSFGESFEFEVNGRRLWAVGANWIPDHCLPSQVTGARVREQLERARVLNMNMLRVWGGGLYESEAFYDACDELGMLVWQDFPYACSYYPEDAPALETARREAEVNVRRLRNHASLALWCGNNENLIMFEDGWGGAARHPQRYYGGLVYEGVLPAVLRELDPGRPYLPTSPGGGERANSGDAGDQHYWDVWHGRGDWKHYDDSTARFSSEFGFASAPGPRSWRRILPGVDPPLAADPRALGARWHDKTAKGYQTFLDFVELHYPRSNSVEEWLYRSQLNQRDALRHGIEHYRRSERCKGTLIWQLNDCWPVQSWALLDSDGSFKAAARELVRLYAPELVSVELRDGRARVWAILDNTRESRQGELVLEARSLADGRSLERWASPVELRPGERRVVLDVPLANLDAERTLLVARWLGTQSCRLLAEPKHVVLPAPELSIARTPHGLSVASDTPVVDLFLWDEGGGLELDENWVTLPAPGSVELAARGEPRRLRARSLQGPHSLVWPPA